MRNLKPQKNWLTLSTCAALTLQMTFAQAQLTDQTQTPNAANEGIAKSFEEQIGAGVGDVLTPDSSLFIVKRDPVRSIRRGRQIFQRKFTRAQGQGPGRQGLEGANIEADQGINSGLVDSCAGCHGRPRGSAGSGGLNFSRPDSRDAPHLLGLGIIEQLADEMTAELRTIRAQAIQDATSEPVTVPLVAKGVNFGSITASPDGSVDTAAVEGVDADLRIRPLGANGIFFAIREFINDASHSELGMPIWDPILADAQSQEVATPAGMVLNGATDRVEAPRVSSASDDRDQDGVVDEMPEAAVDHLEFYLLNYFKPATGRQNTQTNRGRELMDSTGCTSCHVPDMVINKDRRVADVETTFDAQRGIFNGLFATVTASFTEEDDGSGFPSLKVPNAAQFVAKNFFSDLKRHDLGPNFHEIQFDGSIQKEFVTEALWGVGTTAPYGHDGRSINLQEVILRHGGEAETARNAFANLPEGDQLALITFLQSLVLFPPDDTASNLDPGDPTAANFPQNGHGSIRLPELFNDPTDLE